MHDRVGGNRGEPFAVGGMILERLAERRFREQPSECAPDAARDVNAAARVESKRDIARHAAEETEKHLDRVKRLLMPGLRIRDHLIRGQSLSAERAVEPRDAGTG